MITVLTLKAFRKSLNWKTVLFISEQPFTCADIPPLLPPYQYSGCFRMIFFRMSNGMITYRVIKPSFSYRIDP